MLTASWQRRNGAGGVAGRRGDKCVLLILEKSEGRWQRLGRGRFRVGREMHKRRSHVSLAPKVAARGGMEGSLGLVEVKEAVLGH